MNSGIEVQKQQQNQMKCVSGVHHNGDKIEHVFKVAMIDLYSVQSD